MSRLAITLKVLRENRNLSMEELASKAGISRGIIGEIERNKTKSSIKTLEKIAKALDLNEKEREELFSSFMPEEIGKKIVKGNAKILTDDDLIDMRVMGKASAGNGYINLDECLYIMKVRKNGYHKDCYLIEVAGDSMEPLINDGAFVIVDPKQTEYIKDKIFIVNYNDETFVKKVEIDDKAKIMILKSINPEYGNVYIPEKESQHIKIMGRAVKFFYEANL